MLHLPVNRWNLQFSSSELELQFEESQKKFQLLLHQTMTTCGTIVALICLIVFVAQNQSIVLILEMVVATIIMFCQLLISKKILSHMRKFYIINYLCCVVLEFYIINQGVKMYTSILGHAYCLTLLSCLQLCPNKIKFCYLVITPIAMLIFQESFLLDNLQFILYLIEGTISIGLIMYWSEFNTREAFYNQIIASKYQELLSEYTNYGLFAISLNERTSQFELQFQNKQIKDLLSKEFETESMKQFLRGSFIIHTDPINKHDCLNRKQVQKIRFEDYLFLKIREQNNLNSNFLDIKEISYEQNEKATIFQISIKVINLGQKTLYISLKYNHINELIDKHQKQIKKYHQIIIHQSLEISKISSTFLESINKLEENKFNRSLLLNLKCINMQLRNLINNYIVYFQQEKLINASQNIRRYRLNDFIDQLESYFKTQSKMNSKYFQLINNLPHHCDIKINGSVLSQILLNVFEKALDEALPVSTIYLITSIGINLNPLKNTQYVSLENNTIAGVEESQQGQMLLQFSMNFEGKGQIQQKFFENYKNTSEKLITNTKSTMVNTVTQLLLNKIGPYNNIITHARKSDRKQTFRNSMKFFVYADSTLLDNSYTQFLQLPTCKF